MSKGFWKDYFSFSKHERTAVFVLLFIILFFIFLPGFFAPKLQTVTVDKELQRRLDSLTALAENEPGNESFSKTGEIVREPKSQNIPVRLTPFNFDPNVLPADGFKQMGLKDKTVQTIINYRTKGGEFRKPADIRKIYGLSSAEADQLMPYIQISTERAATIVSTSEQSNQSSPSRSYSKIDINKATEEEWKALPGIGAVLSKRIVKFRSAVGGFKSVEDVRKTYGLPDSTYRLILPYLMISESNNSGNR